MLCRTGNDRAEAGRVGLAAPRGSRHHVGRILDTSLTSRRRSIGGSVEDFERRMEFLAHAEVNGTTGRWIVTPRKGARFIGDAERRRARVRDRRRRVLVFLIEAIGVTFLIGLVPPLRVVWNVTAGAGDPARRLRVDADLDEAPHDRRIRATSRGTPAIPRRPRGRLRRPLRDRGPERPRRARCSTASRGSARATGCTSWSDPPPIPG